MPKPHYTKFTTSTQCIEKFPHAYKLIPLDVVIILKNFSARILCIFFIIFCLVYFICPQFLFVVLRCTLIQQWQKQGVQSILEGYSVDDSERSLPQVPNETLGLSSVSQTLSSSFNRLRKGITNRIGKHTSQAQHQTPNVV